jgi:PAS domain S-box-containing protein
MAKEGESAMQIKILVVDDSASDRLIIESMLSEYEILTACDGLEAINVLEKHDGINLLILDLNMPNMDGFQVLEYLKGNKRYKKLRTIILTNYNELDNEIKGLKLGAVDYIRKPIHMQSLKARIDVHVALLLTQNALVRQLHEKDVTFETIFKKVPVGIAISFIREGDSKYYSINPAYENITGRGKEELLKLGWASITHPEDIDEEIKNFERLKAGEIDSYSMDKRFIRPDGSDVWVRMTAATLALDDSHSFNYIVLCDDITESKLLEEKLEESERSKSTLLSHLPGMAYRCEYTKEWTMHYVSAGCQKLTGYPAKSLLYNKDLAYSDLIATEYRDLVWNEWGRVLKERRDFSYEYEIITATGERKWVLELGQGVFNQNGEVEALEGIIIDISDRKEIENILKYNNIHDRWTGLYNREYLVSVLEKDLKLKKDMKKAIIGIYLSMVQVTVANYDYQYSQKLIRKVAKALNQLCSDNCILFQPREHRFIIYIYDYKDKQELIDLGNVIVDTLESLLVTERIGGGIGIVEIEPGDHDIDTESLLRRAIIASEKSMSLFGKDFEICFYDHELEALVNRERDIVEALNLIALDINTNDDLFLQYQPIINLKTGSIYAFEALARLKTEKLGLVSPLEFIPIAEKTKLIIPIGEKVLINAFEFLNTLKEHGYDDISVSINISVIQLLNPDFTIRLFELIRQMQVNPKNIALEITESVFASDNDSINNTLDRLRKTRIHIAIDDFGTGYSSFSREKELKADCMKIDKCFIDELLQTELDKAITGDIISIAHKLGHYTIAEGVESNIQLNYLREFNCDRVQGYYISKPLDEIVAIEFLKKYGK